MEKQKQKELITATLDQVDRAALPLFIKDLKIKTLMRRMFGEISEDTAETIMETITEYTLAHRSEVLI
ncbi:MAG: hypothetical protein IJX88_05260 [Clostridia bacterium]|nr:hypothetical protein [Clostridia bacterium]